MRPRYERVLYVAMSRARGEQPSAFAAVYGLRWACAISSRRASQGGRHLQASTATNTVQLHYSADHLLCYNFFLMEKVAGHRAVQRLVRSPEDGSERDQSRHPGGNGATRRWC